MMIVTSIALALLGLAIIAVVIRIIAGPTLADRILALDTLTVLGVAVIGVFVMRTSVWSLVDVAVALCLVGFLATCAFARYLLNQP